MQSKPFLILGHHRSGTNFLNELIQHHPKFSTINEPLSMHTTFFREMDLIPWIASEYDSVHLHPSLLEAPQLIEFLIGLKQWLIHPYPSHTRGIKETILFEKLQWLKMFLPTLKVIFLVRDPRAVIASIMRSNLYNSIWKYHQTIPRYLKTYSPDQTGSLALLDLFIYSWKIRYQLARQYCHLFEHIFIRLEDLIQNPNETLELVMEFLGSEIVPQQIEFLKHSQIETRGKTFSSYRKLDEVLYSWRNMLSNEHRSIIESSLYHEMEGFGYL